jgi:hypothetical protein
MKDKGWLSLDIDSLLLTISFFASNSLPRELLISSIYSDRLTSSPKEVTPLKPTSPAFSMALAGLVFAITGGVSGIGFATAQILSERGATVCIADVDPEAMIQAEEYFKPLNVLFTITKVDISKKEDVESWIDSIIEKFGRLDGAANVAGIIGKHHGVREVKDLDDDEWDKIIAVNLTGTMLVMLLCRILGAD